MEIIIQPDSQQASQVAARIVARTVREKPHAVIGLATGNTPLQLYRILVEMHREQGLDFSGVTCFNLDEYLGLPQAHPSSYHSYMWAHLFSLINVAKERIHIPDGLAQDIPASCRKYEQAIRSAGGIDVQVLGIGTNGHIGFNEPSSSLQSRTRIKTLTDETRRSNAAGFGSEAAVPTHVITMGLGTIMESRLCLLLAFGKKKARAVAQTVEGPVTAMVPGSVLQMHPRAILVLDREAASELKMAEYYSWVYEHKPGWQKY
ncbi:MAG TPA: glucosamine-6-phosphate deaminase [Candidatus Aminicenantes bacterium]|nr:glucosamine-6-phosphate deaminase [Candidatus Aminicenantes bacterium]